MNSQMKVHASAPGEAVIVVGGKADQLGNNLTLSFPQFSSISSQKILKQDVDGEDLLLTIDADSLGDILEPGSPYQIKIPEIDCLSTIIWPEVIGKRGDSKGVINTNTLTSKPAPIIEEQKEEREVVEDQVDTTPTKDFYVDEEEAPLIYEEPKKAAPIILIASIISILILLLAGGGFWYFKHHKSHDNEVKKEQVVKKEQPKPQEVTQNKPTVAPVKPPEPAPNFAESLQKMTVTDVINKAPNTAMITKEGERRLDVKQFDDAILLLENAASKGDTAAMLKLGALYSPVDFKTGGAIPNPDMREAARYYQKAEQGGSKEAVAPRAALKDWLTKKAETGDEMARLTLKDFWQ